MSAALWMIIYDLDQRNADRYLQWFDDVHIPEKLARPGYTWAAHYQVEAPDGEPTSRYVALFGGRDSRVFYNPSPAQIKPMQPPETRSMMACRSNSQMLILTEEWSRLAESSPSEVCRIDAARIRLALFDANGNDEELGAWLVQDYLERAENSGHAHKFLASTGSVRHLLIQQCSDKASETGALAMEDSAAWSQQVSGYLSYPTGMPVFARRIWPASD